MTQEHEEHVATLRQYLEQETSLLKNMAWKSDAPGNVYDREVVQARIDKLQNAVAYVQWSHIALGEQSDDLDHMRLKYEETQGYLDHTREMLVEARAERLKVIDASLIRRVCEEIEITRGADSANATLADNDDSRAAWRRRVAQSDELLRVLRLTLERWVEERAR